MKVVGVPFFSKVSMDYKHKILSQNAKLDSLFRELIVPFFKHFGDRSFVLVSFVLVINIVEKEVEADYNRK